MNSKQLLRVATYNIHKCRGLDGRVSVKRIARVLNEIRPDIVALQEVVNIESESEEKNQAQFICRELGLQPALGRNRLRRGEAYGNVTLTRFPIVYTFNHDISVDRHEQRGCLRTDLLLPSTQLLHVFNIHLGTGHFERKNQARRLMAEDVLLNPDIRGLRLVMGDFNEWTRGLASILLAAHLRSADIRRHMSRSRTYPGVFPVLHLDHIYHDQAMHLENLMLHRSRTALLASDHLPLVADLLIPSD